MTIVTIPDLYAAAAIKLLTGQTPTAVVHGRLVQFAFPELAPARAQELTAQYYRNALQVDPRRLAEEIRLMKQLLHEARAEVVL